MIRESFRHKSRDGCGVRWSAKFQFTETAIAQLIVRLCCEKMSQFGCYITLYHHSLHHLILHLHINHRFLEIANAIVKVNSKCVMSNMRLMIIILSTFNTGYKETEVILKTCTYSVEHIWSLRSQHWYHAWYTVNIFLLLIIFTTYHPANNVSTIAIVSISSVPPIVMPASWQ